MALPVQLCEAVLLLELAPHSEGKCNSEDAQKNKGKSCPDSNSESDDHGVPDEQDGQHKQEQAIGQLPFPEL